uniref:Uncharacterized protein n=1 Tax=Vitis vinifera TaxID=29760 RepID=F6HTW7_VITVI
MPPPGWGPPGPGGPGGPCGCFAFLCGGIFSISCAVAAS